MSRILRLRGRKGRRAATFKVPGGADWIGTFTASEDGKTLTDGGGPKGGEKTKSVYEKR